MPTAIGWVALAGVVSTIVAFMLGFSAYPRLAARRHDELTELGRRLPFGAAPDLRV